MRRLEVFRRDGFRCVYCAREHDVADLSVDHVEPRRKGGDNSRGNVVTACRACNVEKGGRAAWDYLQDRPEKRANFLRLARHVWPRLRTAVMETLKRG